MTDQTEVPVRRRRDAAISNAAIRSDVGLNGSGGVLLCSVLFVLAVVILVAGRLTNTEALNLTGGFGVVVFGLGAAPLQLVGRLDIYARLTGATLIGLSIVIGGGALMA